jgi:5'-phosphate synthase pdxT subunit
MNATQRTPIASPSGEVIGVLDLQGGVCEHLDHLQRLGISGRAVKQEEDFSGLAGLILPGGESTCLGRLLQIFALEQVIIKKYDQGMKLWGTCAGAILLASKVVGEGNYLNLIDIEIQRNGFGSQLDSFQSEALIPEVSAEPVPLTFIRAPKILRVGKGVHPLLRIGDFIAAAESPGVLATVFHPELTPNLALHRYFARKCGLAPYAERTGFDPSWNLASWTRLARRV